MAGESDEGCAVLGGIAILIGVGYVALMFIVKFWFFVIMGLGAMIIIYGYHVGSYFGGEQANWSKKFKQFGSLVCLVGGVGFMYVALERGFSPRRVAIEFGTPSALGLVGVHIFGLCTAWLSDRIWEFANGYEPNSNKKKPKQKQHYQKQQSRSDGSQKQSNSSGSNSKERSSGGAKEGTTTKAQALEILGMKSPYDAATLQTRWKTMLKKNHPDVDGSTMLTRMVNEAYEVLKKHL